jgi:F-type H+-transporting ATPase subunit gamma
MAKDASEGKEAPLLVCIGNKGLNYFSKRGYQILSEYLEPPESILFADVKEIAKPILELYNNEEIDEITVVYTIFVSTIEQHTKIEKLLPFEPKTSGETETKKHKELLEYEPDPGEVFNYLVPKYAEIMMYRALVESAACEYAARRMAMQNATDNAREMIDSLNLFYNRARQAAITSEITEIVSGADAVK